MIFGLRTALIVLTWTEELSLCTIEAESEVILLIVLIIIDLGKSTPSFVCSLVGLTGADFLNPFTSVGFKKRTGSKLFLFNVRHRLRAFEKVCQSPFQVTVHSGNVTETVFPAGTAD